MPAVAMTDSQNMFGAIRHYRACRSLDLQPILGAEINVARKENGPVDHITLLASNLEGYKNIIKIVSAGHAHSRSIDTPSVIMDTIADHAKGVIALTGCMNGVVPQQVLEFGEDAGLKKLAELKDIFDPGALFVELNQHGFSEQLILNGILRKTAKDLQLPTVATNSAHFMNQGDATAQLYLECIRRGRTYEEAVPTHHGSDQMYLKSADEMVATFPDDPESIKNTLRVAEMCSGLELKLGEPMLPNFPVPEGHNAETYFRKVAQDGLEERFEEFKNASKAYEVEKYTKRLEREIGVINSMKFPGYFLIVWDFIKEAKKMGIPVGPGRGSGAGSLVAYSMGITDLDPLPYNLLFERFLNPERVSMPDFDIDFCMSRRDKVIDYVAEKYGRTSVGQIATYQNLKARSVIKDVARAMGIPAQDAQRIASMIHEKGPGQTYTIAEALEVEPKLKNLADTDQQVAELIKQSLKLEGLTRHAGMHAAGVVISEGPLDDHVPIFKSDESLVTQYDKTDVEDAGLVKFDFLGLKTLTVIDNAEKLVNARPDRKGKPLKVIDLPLNDQATFDLITSGDTTGVFQLESTGMQQLLKQLKPDCFEDIVAVVALYRPGPLGTGMVDDFVATKHGRKETRKLDPLIDDILAPTYGVPVYQEQVMQIAQQLSGYTLGGADVLRRAMGKKKASEMEKQKKIFIDGAKERGVAPEKSEAIFNEIEGFASYGFNKSHSAAYALVTYQTAYLKAHYPTEFFAAALTTDKEKIDKVVRTITEARAWGVDVLPPDINASATNFAVVYQNPKGDLRLKRGKRNKLHDAYGPQIRFGLGAVRGVGAAALESVFDVRSEGGAFKDLFDFASRVDGRKLNRGVLEALVQCGAFDTVCHPIGIHRGRCYAAVERALERARSTTRDREAGQSTLFGMFASAQPEEKLESPTSEYPDAEAWDRLEMLRREKAALGCYVSGHPLFRYGSQVGRVGALSTDELRGADAWSLQQVAGVIESYQERIFKKGAGGKAAFFEIEDIYGRVRAKLKGSLIDQYAHLLTSGDALLLRGKVSFPMTDEPQEEKEPTLLVDSVEPLADAVLAATSRMSILLTEERAKKAYLTQVKETLDRFPGERSVEIQVTLDSGAEVTLALPQKIAPNDDVLSSLERIFGDTVVELA